MRLWSIDPHYLDRIGLIALWREGLLAQKVLQGKTRGYTHHPQLERFRSSNDPIGAIGAYLHQIALHATTRGYRFDHTKIAIGLSEISSIAITTGQLQYEFSHLLKKLSLRNPQRYHELQAVTVIKPHPLFYRIRGGRASWEKCVDSRK